MTLKHSDIITKFKIEYDKADIASSYPSLTNYEIATILDKAYLALINQKAVGNNPRRMAFEGDMKAIEDIRPLLVTTTEQYKTKSTYVQNCFIFDTPEDMLYFVQGTVKLAKNGQWKKQTVQLISHSDAVAFYRTENNIPWIKNAVITLEADGIHLLYDDYTYSVPKDLNVLYIKKPNLFLDDKDGSKEFELNNSMAEELIDLAIIFATQNVESPKLNTAAQLRPLES